MSIIRRDVLSGAASLISLGVLPVRAFALDLQTIEVFKTATCGCCHDWIAHLQDAGFAVAAQDLEYDALADLKQTAGVPDALVSCHTGRIAGYVIEGPGVTGCVSSPMARPPQISVASWLRCPRPSVCRFQGCPSAHPEWDQKTSVKPMT